MKKPVKSDIYHALLPIYYLSKIFGLLPMRFVAQTSGRYLGKIRILDVCYSSVALIGVLIGAEIWGVYKDMEDGCSNSIRLKSPTAMSITIGDVLAVVLLTSVGVLDAPTRWKYLQEIIACTHWPARYSTRGQSGMPLNITGPGKLKRRRRRNHCSSRGGERETRFHNTEKDTKFFDNREFMHFNISRYTLELGHIRLGNTNGVEKTNARQRTDKLFTDLHLVHDRVDDRDSVYRIDVYNLGIHFGRLNKNLKTTEGLQVGDARDQSNATTYIRPKVEYRTSVRVYRTPKKFKYLELSIYLVLCILYKITFF